jgi:hypothetical protein
MACRNSKWDRRLAMPDGTFLRPRIARHVAVVAAWMLCLLASSGASAHSAAYAIRSTGDSSGALACSDGPVGTLPLSVSTCAGGTCLLIHSDVAFATPDKDLASPPLYALDRDTAVRLQLVSADSGASVKVGSTVLDSPGESAQLGTAWSLHAHPILQVTAAQGTEAAWTIVVKLTTKSAKYTESAPITWKVSSWTGTTTTTTTLEDAVCGDGVVEGSEVCDAGAEAWKIGLSCRDDCTLVECGDLDADGRRTAVDALHVLRGAVGLGVCEPCVCNVDGSLQPSGSVSVSDALFLLRVAVGVSVTPPSCPPCS